MSPEFNVGDHTFVETDIKVSDLKHGSFIIAQHKDSDTGVLRQLIVGGSVEDAYLVGLNKEIPDNGILPLSEFTFIGKVIMKVTNY